MTSKASMLVALLLLFVVAVSVVAADEGGKKQLDVTNLQVVESPFDAVEASSAPSCEAALNGSFEQTAADGSAINWTETYTGTVGLIYEEADLPDSTGMKPIPDGNNVAWLGGENNADDSICQSIYLPEASPATLSLQLNMIISDTAATVDQLILSIDGNTFGIVDPSIYGCTTACTTQWQPLSYDFTSPALAVYLDDSVHEICLRGVNDDNDLQTSFFIDDVSFDVGADAGSCLPTSVMLNSADTTKSNPIFYVWALTALGMITMIAIWHASFGDEQQGD